MSVSKKARVIASCSSLVGWLSNALRIILPTIWTSCSLVLSIEPDSNPSDSIILWKPSFSLRSLMKVWVKPSGLRPIASLIKFSKCGLAFSSLNKKNKFLENHLAFSHLLALKSGFSTFGITVWKLFKNLLMLSFKNSIPSPTLLAIPAFLAIIALLLALASSIASLISNSSPLMFCLSCLEVLITNLNNLSTMSYNAPKKPLEATSLSL